MPSPKEQELLKELEQILDLSVKVRLELDAQRALVKEKEKECAQTRRELISLKEENQNLREIMRT